MIMYFLVHSTRELIIHPQKAGDKIVVFSGDLRLFREYLCPKVSSPLAKQSEEIFSHSIYSYEALVIKPFRACKRNR